MKLSLETINARLTKYQLRCEQYSVSYIRFNNKVEIVTRRGIKTFFQRLRSNLDVDQIYHENPKIGIAYLYNLKIHNSKKGGASTAEGFKTGKIIPQWKGKPSNKKGIPSGIIPWNKGKSKLDDARLDIISQSRMGQGNPMYGKTHTIHNKKAASERVKKSILEGIFTPNAKNSRTHWEIVYKDKKFRSSWEAAWWFLNPSHEFEKIRIEFFYQGKSKIYIVDFVDYENRKLIELKPKSHQKLELFEVKRQAAIEWCKKNNFEYIIIDENFFIEQLPNLLQSDLPDDIKKKIQSIRKGKYEN